MNVDVAIVGAGPAGSTLAAILARRGVSVALVDRDEFPRDKLCGEFLSYDALPILDRLGVTFDAPPIARCRVVARHRVYEFDFPAPARGVSRHLLDELLFRTAIAAGAQSFAGWTATSLDPLTIERDGERQAIEAKVIVGAWDGGVDSMPNSGAGSCAITRIAASDSNGTIARRQASRSSSCTRFAAAISGSRRSRTD